MNDIYLENINLNEREFLEKRIVLESKPIKILVTLTNRCNFKCRMCRCSIRTEDLTLPYEYISQITALLPYLNYVGWQGGEVFLVDYFKDVFKEICQYPHIVQEITTNASLISEEWAEIISASNIRLIVSIDSLNKKTFANIRKGGRLEDVIRGASLIKKAREKNNKTIFDSGINIIVMQSNYKELESFVEFARDYKFNFLNFMYLVDNLALEEHIFEPLDFNALNYLRESMTRLIDRAKNLGIGVCYEFEPFLSNNYLSSDNIPKSDSQPFKNNDGYLCRLPWTWLFINAAREGIKVYPQCICEMPVGELSKNTLEEIWNNETMQLYRDKILNHKGNNWCNYRCVKGLVNREFLQKG